MIEIQYEEFCTTDLANPRIVSAMTGKGITRVVNNHGVEDFSSKNQVM